MNMITNRNRYVGQSTPRQRLKKEVHTPPKKWRKVRHIEDMEYENARLIPIYKNDMTKFYVGRRMEAYFGLK